MLLEIPNINFFVVDCQWAEWGNWASCSQTCGGGSQQRKRKYRVNAENGGAECIGSSLENQSCKEEKCPPGKFQNVLCTKNFL